MGQVVNEFSLPCLEPVQPLESCPPGEAGVPQCTSQHEDDAMSSCELYNTSAKLQLAHLLTPRYKIKDTATVHLGWHSSRSCIRIGLFTALVYPS